MRSGESDAFDHDELGLGGFLPQELRWRVFDRLDPGPGLLQRRKFEDDNALRVPSSFKNHHPAYVSSTEVNGTAIATGVYPQNNGIGANTDYRPLLGWTGPNATEGVEAVRRWDLLSGGKYLLSPTLPEIIQRAGFPTITAGTTAIPATIAPTLK